MNQLNYVTAVTQITLAMAKVVNAIDHIEDEDIQDELLKVRDTLRYLREQLDIRQTRTPHPSEVAQPRREVPPPAPWEARLPSLRMREVPPPAPWEVAYQAAVERAASRIGIGGEA